MSQIVVLPTPEKVVNAHAVERLEHMLAMARSGEIESFIAAAFKPNGNWTTVLSGQFDTLKKIGALEAMKRDLLKTLDV